MKPGNQIRRDGYRALIRDDFYFEGILELSAEREAESAAVSVGDLHDGVDGVMGVVVRLEL